MLLWGSLCPPTWGRFSGDRGFLCSSGKGLPALSQALPRLSGLNAGMRVAFRRGRRCCTQCERLCKAGSNSDLD